jgi:cytochrome c-type biogenesis protein
VFILLGTTASALGAFLFERQDFLREFGGVVMMLMGLFQLDIIAPRFLLREWRPALTAAGKSGGAFFLGAAFVFGWIPCTSPLLGAILAYAGTKDSAFYGAYLLAVYSAGFGLPLLLAALAAGGFARKLRGGSLAYLTVIRKVAGLIMLLVGLLLYLDKLSAIIP